MFVSISHPWDTGENNLVRASVGEELETTHLNEVWDSSWINMDGALNENITQDVPIVSGALECMFSRIRTVVQNGVQRPLVNYNFQENSLKEDSGRLQCNCYSACYHWEMGIGLLFRLLLSFW